jgi:hypothetical protein
MNKCDFHDKIKKRLGEIGIKTQREHITDNILNITDEVIKPLCYEESNVDTIKQSFVALSNKELIDSLNDMTKKIELAETSDNDILDAVKHARRSMGSYREVSNYLISKGKTRESIDRRIVDMRLKDKIWSRGGSSLEADTKENPSHPQVDMKKYYDIGYIVEKES